jgi:ankyrin repeat protein
LHWACINGRYDIVDLLLQNGAKQFIPDADGFFPIDYAGIFSHENIVKLLIDQHLRELDNSRVPYNEIM